MSRRPFARFLDIRTPPYAVLSQPQRRNIWGGEAPCPRSFTAFRMTWLKNTVRVRHGQPPTAKGFLGGAAAKTMIPAKKAAAVNTINGNW